MRHGTAVSPSRTSSSAGSSPADPGTRRLDAGRPVQVAAGADRAVAVLDRPGQRVGLGEGAAVMKRGVSPAWRRLPEHRHGLGTRPGRQRGLPVEHPDSGPRPAVAVSGSQGVCCHGSSPAELDQEFTGQAADVGAAPADEIPPVLAEAVKSAGPWSQKISACAPADAVTGGVSLPAGARR